ncbi:hypothetical protein Bbelb_174130 [Branchiostoma belcheri]|nr:hypothetical protein Bbelb_174130 [Branchiostoma belcheri]
MAQANPETSTEDFRLRDDNVTSGWSVRFQKDGDMESSGVDNPMYGENTLEKQFQMKAQTDHNTSTVYAQNDQNTSAVYAQNDQTSTVNVQNYQNTSVAYAQIDQNTSTVTTMYAQKDQNTSAVYMQKDEKTRTVYAQNAQNPSALDVQSVQSTSSVYAQNDKNASAVYVQKGQNTSTVTINEHNNHITGAVYEENDENTNANSAEMSDILRSTHAFHPNQMYEQDTLNPNTTYMAGDPDSGHPVHEATGRPAVRASFRSDNREEDPVIQPYAIRYDDDDDDGYSNNDLTGCDVSGNATSVGDDSVPHAICRRRHLVQVAVTGAVILLLGIVGALTGIVYNIHDTQQMTSAVDTTYTTTTDEDLLSTVQFANDTFWTRDPTLPSTYSSTQESHDGGVISEKIIIIGAEEGSKYGYKYRNDRGVVVSEDNEIFVSDLDTRRIDVYSMNGTHLRHFPTELPDGNEQKMLPYDVAMDGQGHLWAPVLKRYRDSDAYVVQYSQDGQPLSKFAFQSSRGFPHIDFDVRTNKIILVNGSQIVMFHPNGTLYQTFENKRGLNMNLQYAASDKDGNIFVTEQGYSIVQVYNPSGNRLFKFGGYGSGDGKLNFPRGIRVDTSGHVIVANEENGRVDVFTSRGEFLLTAAKITKPWNLAVGPDGPEENSHTHHDDGIDVEDETRMRLLGNRNHMRFR